MSVLLNEVALAALLESPTGPVGEDLERRARNVQIAYQQRVNYVITNPVLQPQVGYAIEHDAQGLYAVIGIPDEGKVAEYLAPKFARETDKARGALQEGFDE